MMRRLRRGYVEAVVEAVLEALQDVALVLERVTRREMQLPRHDPHDHAGVSERATSSIDRKSTRLNSSHLVISYAVFCLKKKKRSNIDLSVHYVEKQDRYCVLASSTL